MQRIRQRLNLWQRARVRCGAGGGGARGGAAAQPKDGARRDALIGVVAAPPSADDAWLRLEELAHCQEKVAEYDAAALRRHAARWSNASSASVPNWIISKKLRKRETTAVLKPVCQFCLLR